jgi:hypothetical protein
MYGSRMPTIGTIKKISCNTSNITERRIPSIFFFSPRGIKVVGILGILMALAFPPMLLKCLLMESRSGRAGYEHVMNDASYYLLSRRDKIEQLSIKGAACLPGTLSLLAGRTGLAAGGECQDGPKSTSASLVAKRLDTRKCFSRNVPKSPL